MSTPREARSAFARLFIATGLILLAAGATLPVLPRFVTEELGGGQVEVGIVIGAFSLTGLACRPLAGRFADVRGRRPAVLIGASGAALAGFVLLLPAGLGGLIAARMILGAGEGTLYTAASAWVVDIAPPARRGRLVGLFGLAIWGGLSLGAPIGEVLRAEFGYTAVWAFATLTPVLAAATAATLREPAAVAEASDSPAARGSLIHRGALLPGAGLALASMGFATVAGFIVLSAEQRGLDVGAIAFTAFAGSVVAMRVIGGGLPDRLGAVPCAVVAGFGDAVGLVMIALAGSAPVLIAGAAIMGASFSLIFPSLALLVLGPTPPERRGAAMGTFTACFDLGLGIGGPIAGAIAQFGGYEASFLVMAAGGLGIAAIAASQRRRRRLDVSFAPPSEELPLP
ncbi:MFS transporter [Thermoleophilia bacterium SCSIO 60948]|nr:MFS transporter [Thermoleophilia bacterium SCSIO 60948]